MMSSDEIMLFGVRVKVVDPMRKSVSMNDLSQYVHVLQPGNSLDASAAIVADNGYASADDASAVRSNQSNGVVGRERKRGVPWTEEEHKLFLLGLQKVGKGDWRGISRNFVKTRTPTQVASHAQKYFLRRTNLNRCRRRSSLFDITTDSVAAASPMELVHEDSNTQISPPSGFPMAAFPATVPSPLPIENQAESVGEQLLNEGPTLIRPTPPLFPSKRADHNSLSLSLNLSLSSYDNNQRGPSAFHVIPGFNNGNGLISVG